MFFPHLMLSLLDIPDTAAPVARIFGMILLFLFYYYFMTGRRNDNPRFYSLTVHTRISAFVIACLFALFRWISPLIILFVVVDVAGALWTLFALRRGRESL